jgi:hypothetical protein
MARPSASATQRPTRTPISGRNVLTVNGKEPGYNYRIVNDNGDRISQFLEAGYELVDASTVSVGDKRVNVASAEGTKAQVSVGKGDKAFVMRIRQDWFDEDQKAKQAKVNEIEESIKQKSGNADYGTIKIGAGTG